MSDSEDNAYDDDDDDELENQYESNEADNSAADDTSDNSSVICDFDWVMILFCPFISINPFIFFVVSANNPNNYHNNPSAS